MERAKFRGVAAINFNAVVSDFIPKATRATVAAGNLDLLSSFVFYLLTYLLACLLSCWLAGASCKKCDGVSGTVRIESFKSKNIVG